MAVFFTQNCLPKGLGLQCGAGANSNLATTVACAVYSVDHRSVCALTIFMCNMVNYHYAKFHL